MSDFFNISRRYFSSGLAVGALGLSGARLANAAAVGKKAPAFTAVDAAGKSHKLSDFAGKLVVLEWTNPGCPFVVKHYSGNAQGNMQALQKEFTAKGVVWLSVNSTETGHSDYLTGAKHIAWTQEKQAAPTATLMDASGAIGQLYGAKTTPHLFIISPTGQLVYAGGIDSIASAQVADIKQATNYVRQGLGEALAGKPISVASSRPYGCSVKYKT